jgi:hypothetical protein
MSKKYKLTDETLVVDGHKLYRIKALRSFSDVKKGDFGGYVENESNLSHDRDCWVYDDAKAFENAMVSGNARVNGDARVCGYARVYDSARVCGYARVYDSAQISGNARVYDSAQISGNARVYGSAEVYVNAHVHGTAHVSGKSKVSGNCILKFNAWTHLDNITLDHGVWTTNSYTIDNNDYIISNTLEQLYIGDDK